MTVGARSSVDDIAHTEICALGDHLLYEIDSDYTPPARAWGYRPATMGTDTLGPCVIRGMRWSPVFWHGPLRSGRNFVQMYDAPTSVDAVSEEPDCLILDLLSPTDVRKKSVAEVGGDHYRLHHL